MITNRKEARSTLYTLLAASLTGAQAGYKYAAHDFGGASPVFYLSSSGTESTPMTGRGVKNRFFINVHLLTLYASGDVYTEEIAEDTLDLLEDQLRQAMAVNRKTADWQDARFAGRSSADAPLMVGGELYLHEVISIVMEAY